MRVLRFLISGGIGISVNLGMFHLLVILGTSYLTGSIIAFLFAMIVGFLLQKYWTFEDRAPERVQRQLFWYASLALGNLALNTLIVYALIEYRHIYYLVAQAVGAGSVALTSYVVYSLYIFADTSDT